MNRTEFMENKDHVREKQRGDYRPVMVYLPSQQQIVYLSKGENLLEEDAKKKDSRVHFVHSLRRKNGIEESESGDYTLSQEFEAECESVTVAIPEALDLLFDNADLEFSIIGNIDR